MTAILWFSEKLSKLMNVIACIALTFIMLLTVADVVLRLFGHPIIGTFEMVGMGGAVAMGFGIPLTSWMRGHIFVDFFVLKMPKAGQNIINTITRLMSIVLFFLVGYNLMIYATDLYRSGEVSLTIKLPFYPIAYGMGICCFVECLVLICDIIKIIGGKYE
ncbi:MAG: TRAP transporter small permease [Syntrophorhabdaceae bacterium]|nr:TRAP transporter small permease [Syntrophorhabdales bacterium]MBP9560742.1 TRAP transporter small permease [Syntrophorhabdaceae bacterium]